MPSCPLVWLTWLEEDISVTRSIGDLNGMGVSVARSRPNWFCSCACQCFPTPTKTPNYGISCRRMLSDPSNSSQTLRTQNLCQGALKLFWRLVVSQCHFTFEFPLFWQLPVHRDVSHSTAGFHPSPLIRDRVNDLKQIY
jgi:hypothetical protein